MRINKTVEGDHVKETIDIQTTAKTEPVEITTPPPTHLARMEGFSLKQAFKILASFDCSSTTLTIEQKMSCCHGGSLKELANRAAKAAQDKIQLTEKESIKLTITCNLDRNLVRYKEELEALGKEYEANAKAAEEEERSVEENGKE
ncbi:hypothetical protein F3Y22_tig00111881pilonHSYRG00082 [Hibiscus syriacus]|uniref:Uncharacterized protein n=1 Tax=Hibiscus syriacus TaxID=106335 RepID=A0A6A2XPQ8_HIBSY|nr:hypothetical protein F3Y22_tig00111881pilonHSYRG00082 [Hibiscus syriacus]